MGIKLQDKDKKFIKERFSDTLFSGKIQYKEALAHLTINLESDVE